MVIYRSVFLLSKLRSLTIQSRFESSNASEQLQWRRAYMAVVPFGKTRRVSEHIGQTLHLAKHIGRNKCCGLANVLAQKDYATVHSSQYSPVAGDGPDLGRNFFLQQWVEHKKKILKMEKNMDRVLSEELKRQKRLRSSKEPVVGVKYYDDENPLADRTASESVVGRLQSSSREEGIGSERRLKSERYDVKPIAKQPPTSQSVSGPLKPSSPEEARIAPLLARADLLVTRDIEWVNLVAGIEQENRYNIVDVCYPSSPVGFIREQSNLIVRQLLRSRRPFVAHILDALGNELFRVRRPFWWINSTIYAEINGKEIGVVHRRWHLWRRIYDLYLGNKQFAVVENPGFWDWTFTLKDIDGDVLAQIDRNWRGFGFELFTDAGQYVIKFGHAESSSVPIEGMPELTVKRSLTLSERAVVVALAVSLDNDYFSVHGGWHLPFMYVGE